MKRLSKAQEATKAELVETLNKAAEAVREGLTMVNGAIEVHLNPAITAYNEAIGDLEAFRDEIVGDMEAYFDERSDKWRESDAGSNYSSWKGEWEVIDVDQIEEVDEVEEPELTHADILDNLPTEVDQ